MCGRYALGAPRVQIHHMADYPELDVGDAEWIGEDEFEPRYNIAPRSNAPVIRRRNPEERDLVIQTMKWGVIPRWSKHDDGKLNTINARAENLKESGGMWGSMKAKQRCVVVCDGYFEWLKKGKDRLPHFIKHKDGKLMLLAGLYETTLLEGTTTPISTFTVVTTDASPNLSWLHDRQPVILSTNAQLQAWLDTSKGWHKELFDILLPFDGKQLECYPVPKEVGRVGTNSPDFVKPITQRKGGIESLFAKQKTSSSKSIESSPTKDFLKESSAGEASSSKSPTDTVHVAPELSEESPHKKQKTKHDRGVEKHLIDNTDDAPFSKKRKVGTPQAKFRSGSKKAGGDSAGKKSKMLSPSPSKAGHSNTDRKITSFFQKS